MKHWALHLRALHVGAGDRAENVAEATIRVDVRRREVCLVVADVLADCVAGLAYDIRRSEGRRTAFIFVISFLNS